MYLQKQRGKRIGIFGLGMTGQSLYKTLKPVAARVICYDDSEENRQLSKKLFGLTSIVESTDKEWQLVDKIIISPGIPQSHSIYKLAAQYNIEITSDIELFIEDNLEAKFIMITGTNGKSTTTALIGHILTVNKLNYHIGGNIGLPVLSLPSSAEGYILEISSFQLDLLKNLNPEIAVLLNITPDHLDRHGSLEEYINVKEKILNYAKLKVIGIDSEVTNNIYIKRKIIDKNLVAVSGTILLENGISCFNEQLRDNFFDKKIYKCSTTPNLLGRHNFANIAASFAVCRALGVQGEDIIAAILSYKALKHRMQYICEIIVNLGVLNESYGRVRGNGQAASNNFTKFPSSVYKSVSFYNDSKATNTSSTAMALSSLNNIFWLAGGIFKEEIFSLLDNSLKEVKTAYLFGRDKKLFAEYLNSKVEYKIFNTMEGAFLEAVHDSLKRNSNSNILLSPACASYDQFKNFEHRGDVFTALAVKFCQDKGLK